MATPPNNPERMTRISPGGGVQHDILGGVGGREVLVLVDEVAKGAGRGKGRVVPDGWGGGGECGGCPAAVGVGVDGVEGGGVEGEEALEGGGNGDLWGWGVFGGGIGGGSGR